MLTHDDLKQIKEVVATKEDVVSIQKQLKTIEKTVSKVEKTVDIMAKVLDRADVDLNKRVKHIKEHLGLNRTN